MQIDFTKLEKLINQGTTANQQRKSKIDLLIDAIDKAGLIYLGNEKAGTISECTKCKKHKLAKLNSNYFYCSECGYLDAIDIYRYHYELQQKLPDLLDKMECLQALLYKYNLDYYFDASCFMLQEIEKDIFSNEINCYDCKNKAKCLKAWLQEYESKTHNLAQNLKAS